MPRLGTVREELTLTGFLGAGASVTGSWSRSGWPLNTCESGVSDTVWVKGIRTYYEANVFEGAERFRRLSTKSRPTRRNTLK